VLHKEGDAETERKSTQAEGACSKNWTLKPLATTEKKWGEGPVVWGCAVLEWGKKGGKNDDDRQK